MRAILERGVLAMMVAALAAAAAAEGESPEKVVFRSSVGPVTAAPEGEQPAERAAATPAPVDEIERELSSPLFVDLELSYPADPPPAPPGPPTPGYVSPYVERPLGQVGVYLGGIFLPMVAPEDDIDFLEPSVGWGFTVGYAPPEYIDFLGAIGLEVSFEYSKHDDDALNDTASYKRLLVGFKVIDNTHEEIQPYVTVGAGFHDVEYVNTNYDIDGFGGYVGGGIDFYLDPMFSIGVDLKLHWWSGEDNLLVPGDGFTPAAGVSFLVHF